MHALSTTLNTKYMVKPNTLLYFVTQLHTCLHAELDKTFSHIIMHITLHNKHIFCKFYPEMYYSIHVYQNTESIETHWKKYTYHQTRIRYFFFGYVEFERQIQQCFSKCESYGRERGQIKKDWWRERVQGDS